MRYLADTQLPSLVRVLAERIWTRESLGEIRRPYAGKVGGVSYARTWLDGAAGQLLPGNCLMDYPAAFPYDSHIGAAIRQGWAVMAPQKNFEKNFVAREEI